MQHPLNKLHLQNINYKRDKQPLSTYNTLFIPVWRTSQTTITAINIAIYPNRQIIEVMFPKRNTNLLQTFTTLCGPSLPWILKTEAYKLSTDPCSIILLSLSIVVKKLMINAERNIIKIITAERGISRNTILQTWTHKKKDCVEKWLICGEIPTLYGCSRAVQ